MFCIKRGPRRAGISASLRPRWVGTSTPMNPRIVGISAPPQLRSKILDAGWEDTGQNGELRIEKVGDFVGGGQNTECRRQETEKRIRIPDGFPACRDSGQASVWVEQRSSFWGFGRVDWALAELGFWGA